MDVSLPSALPPGLLIAHGLFRGDLLFDHVPDTVFFLKDTQGRYTAVNHTLVQRCGFGHKSELIGKTAEQVFPLPLGSGFSQQDQGILQGGPAINGQLELHLYGNRQPGWCLTWKVAVTNPQGDIVGLAGLSRDIQQHMGSTKEAAAGCRCSNWTSASAACSACQRGSTCSGRASSVRVICCATPATRSARSPWRVATPTRPRSHASSASRWVSRHRPTEA
jgi:hypothetical protein